mmetsp:Transcript_145897/g.254704  ORF Transcript_145897/g.254704 Transcript_145897/m.254704 type:complete len:256 (+) Transcript_145897:1263-2030(+)
MYVGDVQEQGELQGGQGTKGRATQQSQGPRCQFLPNLLVEASRNLHISDILLCLLFGEAISSTMLGDCIDDGLLGCGTRWATRTAEQVVPILLHNPVIDELGMLSQTMLDVNLLLLVPRESRCQDSQWPLSSIMKGVPLLWPIRILSGTVPHPKEQTHGSHFCTLLSSSQPITDKSTARGNSSPQCHQNHRDLRIGRKSKTGSVDPRCHRDWGTLCGPQVSQVTCGQTMAVLTRWGVPVVSNDAELKSVTIRLRG